MFKKFLAAFTAFTAVVHLSANAGVIYENNTIKNLASGVMYTKSVRLEKSGWQNINIIEADLSNPYVTAKVLTATELNTLETVKKHAADNNTTAAINGDFFAWKSGESGKGSAVGTIMKDGELLSSSSETDGMFTFAIDNFNKIICECIKTNITLTAANGNKLKIKHLNKYDSLAEPVIYTSAFSKTTDGSYNNILEVVIKDGVVVEMRKNQEGVVVPENGYVIRHLPEFDPFLVNNLKVGDSVDITFDANINLSDYKTMTGGGTMLVTQGQLAKITHNVWGTNPRTVIACDSTRTKLYLITVDGRQDNAKGYTLSELAQYLIDIGMYDAMNLDGGGSTTMVVNESGNQNVVNSPSEGSLRKVASSIGVISDAPEGNVLSSFEISSKDYNVIAGTTRTFEIINPLDEYGNPFLKEIPYVTWSVDSDYGYFVDNVLHTEKTGDNVTVYATYNGFTASNKINILNGAQSISAIPSHFSIDRYNNTEFVVKGKSEDGRDVIIESADVEIGNANSPVKKATVQGKSTYITFSKILEDFKENIFLASVYPSEAFAKIDKEYKISKSGNSIKLSYDFLNVPNDKTGAAYLEFKNPVNVVEQNKLGIWVYSPTPLNQWLRAEFKTSGGEILRETLTERIDFSGWKYLEFNVPNGAKTLNKLYVVQNSDKEKSKGYVVFDSLSVFERNFSPELTSTRISNETEGEITFSVVAGMPETKTMLTKFLETRTAYTLKDKDYVFSLLAYDFNNMDEIKVSGYSSFTKNKSLFVTVNNSGGYTSVAQWEKFANDTKSDFKNLFVFLNENPDLITNPNERTMFENMLKNISGKANVFVFYPDMHTHSYKSNGATFVSVGNLNATAPRTATMLIGKKQIPIVSISNNTPTLSFVDMY